MNVIWSKIWRDLAHNKIRTGLVVLSTAVGVFALGLVFGTSGVMRAQMMATRQAAVPAHITFSGGPFEQDAVDAARREPGVAAVEGEIVVPLRWKRPGETQWRDGQLVARADYDAQHMNLVRLLAGRWPARRALSVERSSSRYYNIPSGVTILAQVGQREQPLPVEGVVRASDVFPPEWGGLATFFGADETAAWMAGYERGPDADPAMPFTALHIRLRSLQWEAAPGQRPVDIAKRIERRLERMGLEIEGYEVHDPDVHLLQDIVDGSLIVLVVMGVLSLGLSAFLIVNTMNAIVTQQMRQIGVMKAIGATFTRVAGVYLATALVYGALALVLAVPLGVVSAHLMASGLLELFNSEASSLQVSPAAVGIQVAVGLAMPLLAAAAPVIGGVRVTVRQAMSSYGLGAGPSGRLDRLVARVRFLPRPLALGLRNVFRRKTRAALTLAALTLAGAMFTMISSVADSFSHTLRVMFDTGRDVAVYVERPYRASQLAQVAQSVPGVTTVEVWSQHGSVLSRPNGKQYRVDLVGVPSGSIMFNPRVSLGRSLLDGDERAVIVNNRLAEEEAIRVGDVVTLSLVGESSAWTVVGVYPGISSISDDWYVPLDALARATGALGRGTEVQMLVERDDYESQQQLVRALRQAFAAQGIQVNRSWSTSEQWLESQASFGMFTSLLLAMTVLVAVVGGLGLMGALSITVVERTREIGVMRAIGGTSLAIAGTFVAEGAALGALSWLLAVPLSYPGALVFSQVIGRTVVNVPLDFVYSAKAMLLWLGIVVALSALASAWPALRAARVSVREALAYE